MSYYMGDYYPGRRGDPGIFSFLGSVAKKAVGFIPGVGPIASAALSVIPKLGGGGTAVVKSAAPGMLKGVGQAIIKHPVLSAAGAAGAIALGAGAVGAELAGGGCPKGHHISRAKHSKKFGQCVRNRHMNVCNPRALRRAVRRAHGFAKLAMRTIHITHPKKKGRFGGFKKRRRS